MTVQDFIAFLRAQHVDALVAEYAGVLAGRPPASFKDGHFRTLAQLWQSSDEPTRALLRSLMRLASQNTLASVLAVLDNSSSEFREKFSLVATDPSGQATALSQDLLDTFWAQEEAAGHVNNAR